MTSPTSKGKPKTGNQKSVKGSKAVKSSNDQTLQALMVLKNAALSVNVGSPDLVPVPYKNGSFCRMNDHKLIVVVKNIGNAIAADKVTKTMVSWGQGGVYGVKEKDTFTANLAPGDEAAPVEFECPKEKCFLPDCEFYITVDSRNESGEEENKRYNNSKKGVCFKRDEPFLPDLVPEQYKDSKKYFLREGNILKVTIKNKGSAIAKDSKTEVKFADGTTTIKKEPTPQMEPGEAHEIELAIPPAHHTGNFRLKITADVDKQIEESDESNNAQEDRFIEREKPL